MGNEAKVAPVRTALGEAAAQIAAALPMPVLMIGASHEVLVRFGERVAAAPPAPDVRVVDAGDTAPSVP